MSQQRINKTFARLGRRAALIPYIAAGDPDPATTVPLMHGMVRAGADIIELGVPFSDPVADGPIIQQAAERAIAKGVGLRDVLDMVAVFRKMDQTTPVVLMGYANPIEAMGQEAFARAAEKAGVDGVLIVDCPPEEYDDFSADLRTRGISPIFLLSPTSTEARIQSVAKRAEGYLYYVSLKGITGSSAIDINEVRERLAGIKKYVSIPVGVGFGIRDAASAAKVAEAADAVVIGSRLIETITQAIARHPEADASEMAVTAAGDWLREIRQALDQIKK
ncbi:tryptophan synthase subunit alpha [Advenella kashmirensis W13003]|uniref:Tryptophan synthase alpha chain n=1 Tax=Advenella kashmirensis W13003 TaxID=1424334 RepID=V8QQT7_9BURK|nr:tryptophan synthase subunit alpha [Advenella kashmirensis]ETF01665.1 tryptophan synthase subunit alpha [Advenella kashmirensis W13003]